jgi:hypothetical protein
MKRNMDQPIDIKLTLRQVKYLENVLRGYRWKTKEPMHSEIKELLRDVKRKEKERIRDAKKKRPRRGFGSV